nr:alpha-1,2-fucosyltransferase [uncultured Lichenicoccus sp.]
MPTINIVRQGNAGNQAIQYMAALKLASRLGGCRITGVDIPAFGIQTQDADRAARVVLHPGDDGTFKMHLDEALVLRVLAGDGQRRVDLDGYFQRMENFLPVAAYRDLFEHLRAIEVERFGDKHIVCNVRGTDSFLAGHPDYTILPVEFYVDVVKASGRKPVFMGQVEDNAYCRRLRGAFPDARFLPSGGAAHDFELMRRSKHLVVSVSTFSWLAAWLSDASSIVMPLSGIFNPAQFPSIDLLPLRDARYRFWLFPISKAAPADELEAAHATIRGLWRFMRADALEDMRSNGVRRPRRLDRYLGLFDEAGYLHQHPDVDAAVKSGDWGSALEHFVHAGFREGRPPRRVNADRYLRRYPMAAFEIAQFDYYDAVHHYVEVGHERGYDIDPGPV